MLLLATLCIASIAFIWIWRGGTHSADSKAEVAPLRGGTHSADSRAEVAPLRGGTHSADWHTVEGKWGNQPGEFGRLRREEGNAEAPMSLAASVGKLCVLDQVNERVQCFPGVTSTRLSVRAAQDLKLSRDGTPVVLDRLGDQEVVVMSDPPLRFPIAKGGTSSGLFLDGRDIYVEHDHETLTRVGSLDGVVTPLTLPGRPTRDGAALLKAAIVDPLQGRFYVSALERASLAQRFSRELSLPPPLLSLDLLDSDKQGIVYVAANDGAVVTLICLNGTTGATLGTVSLQASDQPDETFQSFTVLDEGGVIYGRAAVDGFSTARADCR